MLSTLPHSDEFFLTVIVRLCSGSPFYCAAVKGYTCRTAKEVKAAVKSAAMGNLNLTTKQRSFHSLKWTLNGKILNGFDSNNILNQG